MNKTIAVFGVGPGLGTSIARHYAQRGYRVALVARRRAFLQQVADTLAAEGIEAQVFTADFSVPAEVTRAIADIETTLGPIDTLYYGPNAPEVFVPAFSLSIDDVQAKMALFLYGIIAAVNQVLPGMRQRKAGSILVALGGSAAIGLPFMSGPGPAMAAARNYLYSLHGELAGEGIHVGMLTLAAVIKNSSWEAGIQSGAIKMDLPPEFTIPSIDPAELAAMLWNLAQERNSAELIYPPMP